LNLPLPPGTRGIPFIGETVDWVRDPLLFAQKRYNRYGPVWSTHLMGRPCAVLLGPDANRFMLQTHRHLFSSRAGWGRSITSLIGDGLSLIDGIEHRRHRQMIMPALHGAMLGRYFDVMHELTAQHVTRWTQQDQFKLFDGFKHLSFGIAARLMLGTRTQREANRFYEQFHRFTGGLFALPAWKLPWLPYGKAWRSGQQLRRTLQEVISARRAAPHADDLDILGLLLNACDADGMRFTDDELIDELLVLLWAGHDTVTSLLTWTLLELLRQPALWARAAAEQHTLPSDDHLSLAHLKHIPLLDNILREAERLHPPAPGGFRGVIEPFEYGGYQIPAGMTAMYSIVWTHHMPELWHAPARFDPDRFLPPRDEGKQPFTLIGFGGGPRICVGYAFAKMQMQIIVSHLLRHCHFEVLPGQDFTPIPVPTKMPKDGLIVRVSKRD
jgi:cytochrome P450